MSFYVAHMEYTHGVHMSFYVAHMKGGTVTSVRQ
jgi:hypothetical protein